MTPRKFRRCTHCGRAYDFEPAQCPACECAELRAITLDDYEKACRQRIIGIRTETMERGRMLRRDLYNQSKRK